MKFIAQTLVLGLFITFNCSAKVLVDLGGFPKWFTDAVAREANIDTTSKIEIPALQIQGEVLSQISLVESGEGYWYYNIDLGSSLPVECYIFTDFDGAANSMLYLVEEALASSESVNKLPLSARYNFALDTGIVNNTPYLAFDTLYSVGDGNKKLSGVVKAKSAQTGKTLEVCLHNELGYHQSFTQVFESFVKAVATSQQQEVLYEASFQLIFNGIPAGYSYETHSIDSDGDVESVNTEAMIFPADATSVTRTDSTVRSWSSAQGSLINHTEFTVENGELSSQFSLSNQDDKWIVTGQLQGKDVNVTLSHNTWLLSDFGGYLAGASLLSSDQDSVAYSMWIPDADPSAVQAVTLSKIANSSDANIKFDMGPFSLDYLANQYGALIKGSMQQGPVSINLIQTSSRGQPVVP